MAHLLYKFEDELIIMDDKGNEYIGREYDWCSVNLVTGDLNAVREQTACASLRRKWIEILYTERLISVPSTKRLPRTAPGDDA